MDNNAVIGQQFCTPLDANAQHLPDRVS